jgi:hypothetical protein
VTQRHGVTLQLSVQCWLQNKDFIIVRLLVCSRRMMERYPCGCTLLTWGLRRCYCCWQKLQRAQNSTLMCEI